MALLRLICWADDDESICHRGASDVTTVPGQSAPGGRPPFDRRRAAAWRSKGRCLRGDGPVLDGRRGAAPRGQTEKLAPGGNERRARNSNDWIISTRAGRTLPLNSNRFQLFWFCLFFVCCCYYWTAQWSLNSIVYRSIDLCCVLGIDCRRIVCPDRPFNWKNDGVNQPVAGWRHALPPSGG